MQQKNDKWILLIILPLILLICYWIWTTRVDNADEVIIISETPEWDLTAFDFNGGQFVRARGSIAEYVPEALLTPEEFESADYIVGKPKNAADYLTSRFRFYVPDGRVYALTTDSADFADRIYINGQLYQEIGRPAANREDMIPQTRAQYYTVTPENGVIEIVQQVSNFVHRDGGNPVGFRIGSIETAGRHYDRKMNMASIVMGACLLLFLVHMALFLMQRDYKANLYFSFFCLVWFFQTGAIGQRVFVALYPQLTWYVAFRMEYMATPLSVLLLLLALDAMFGGLVHRPVKIAAVCFFGAAALFYLAADTLLMSHAKQYINYVVTAVQLYLAARFLLRFYKRREPEAVIVLSGLAVFAYAMLRDMFYHNNIIIFPMVHANFTDFAVLVFILFQMTANFYGTMRQVREAKEREQRIAAEKEALEELARHKSAFYADISHELKTPLTVIAANAQYAAKQITEGRVDDETLVDLDAISAEAKRLAQMVTRLVGLNRMQDGSAEYALIELDTVVGDTARMYKSLSDKRGNALTVTVEPNLPAVNGNADQLSQVLINLLGNANRHTQDGNITVDVAMADGVLRVTVADDGEGIPPELLPTVFERFSRGDEDGTGLGLAICKTIVEAHGGEIGIDSEAGKGTTVWYTLPPEGGKSDE